MGAIIQDRIARTLEKFEREQDTLDEIAQRIAMGEGLAKICTAWDVPYLKVYAWLCSDVKRFAVFENAMVASGLMEADEIKEIADESGEPKLMMDARKFRVPKLAPEMWGDSKDKGGSGVTVIVNRDMAGGGGGGQLEISANVGGVRQSVVVSDGAVL